jgi:hypothetical protein
MVPFVKKGDKIKFMDRSFYRIIEKNIFNLKDTSISSISSSTTAITASIESTTSEMEMATKLSKSKRLKVFSQPLKKINFILF